MTFLRLIRSELSRLTDSILPILTVLALAVVPVIYGGIYLYANWDPTGNLEDVDAALVNLDEGADFDGESQTIGDDVTEEAAHRRCLLPLGRRRLGRGRRGERRLRGPAVRPGDPTGLLRGAGLPRRLRVRRAGPAAGGHQRRQQLPALQHRRLAGLRGPRLSGRAGRRGDQDQLLTGLRADPSADAEGRRRRRSSSPTAPPTSTTAWSRCIPAPPTSPTARRIWTTGSTISPPGWAISRRAPASSTTAPPHYPPAPTTSPPGRATSPPG